VSKCVGCALGIIRVLLRTILVGVVHRGKRGFSNCKGLVG
jgi:hypothetical protein